jgi:tRNA threonylcarbamoyladenosine biosynthesis protein TsaE
MPDRFLADEIETEALGAELAAATPEGGVWLLRGELGAGKTTWTRGFVRGLGGDPEQVASPTYAVLHRYDTPKGRVFHLDLYRLGPDGAWGLGLDEELAPGDFLVAEWPGGDGPWEDRWTGRVSLETEGDGRRVEWTLAGAPSGR